MRARLRQRAQGQRTPVPFAIFAMLYAPIIQTISLDTSQQRRDLVRLQNHLTRLRRSISNSLSCHEVRATVFAGILLTTFQNQPR